MGLVAPIGCTVRVFLIVVGDNATDRWPPGREQGTVLAAGC
jgi:hypothetical protein